jgi:hypothetical protein
MAIVRHGGHSLKNDFFKSAANARNKDERGLGKKARAGSDTIQDNLSITVAYVTK